MSEWICSSILQEIYWRHFCSIYCSIYIYIYIYIYWRHFYSSVGTLLHRAYGVSSSFLSLHKEFLYLKNYFSNNGIPVHLIEHCIKKFLNNKYFSDDLPTFTHDTFPFSLPFLDHSLRQWGRSLWLYCLVYFLLSNLYASLLTKIPLAVVFFNHKDCLPECFRASVVYKFACPRCGSQYVGSSSHDPVHLESERMSMQVSEFVSHIVNLDQ